MISVRARMMKKGSSKKKGYTNKTLDARGIGGLKWIWMAVIIKLNKCVRVHAKP